MGLERLSLFEKFITVPAASLSLTKDSKSDKREANDADKSGNRQLTPLNALRRNRNERNGLCASSEQKVYSVKKEVSPEAQSSKTNDRPNDHKKVHHRNPPYRSYARYSKHITRTARWKALRLEALRRDGFTCVQCGTTGRLEVDHIKPVRTHPDLAYDLSNLQSLCPSCHTKKTRIECGHPPPSPERLAWREAVKQLNSKRRNPQC